MTTLTAGASAPSFPALTALIKSRWLWCVAAALFVLARDLGQGTAALLTSLGDTDDATRLVQVREFLAGSGWYDLVMPRFGGSTPLVSHWSRLIDLPLAVLLTLFGMVMSPEHAELLTRIVWPSLLLVVLFRVLTHEAEMRVGETAAIFVLLFAVTTLSGLFQFRAGRIDHHNLMIIGAVGGLLATIRALETPRLGWLAGGYLGLALVIGYEPIVLIVPLAGLVAIAAVLHPPFLLGVRNLALGLTATLAVGLAISTPVQLWHLGVCDALSLNLLALAAAGAAGLTLLEARGRAWPMAARFGVLAATGAVGVGLYVAADPVCIGGPFARMSRDAIDIWLVHVTEMHSAFKMLETNPTPVLAFVIFAVATLAAAVLRYRQLRTVDAGAMLVVLVVAIPLGLTAMKFIPYASFLAAFALALSVASLAGSINLTPLSARLLGVFAFNQSTLSLLVAPLLLLGGTSKMVVEGNSRSATEACMETPAIRQLAKLPTGFVVANTDLGPFIVALTSHSVLAAPYHRIDGAIIETDRIFKALPDEAEARLRRLNASYVVECFATVAPGQQPELRAGERRQSLLGLLTFGDAVPFLEEIEGASPGKNLRVWRVKPKLE